MVDRERVNSGLDIGEVPEKKLSHIRVDLIALGNWQIGTWATLRFRAFLAPLGLGKPAQGETVSNIPGDPRQLASTISQPSHEVGEWSIHASHLNYA